MTHQVVVMNGATLKSTLTSIGVNAIGFAAYAGVTKRTAVRWMDCVGPVPDHVPPILGDLVDDTNQYVVTLIDAAERDEDGDLVIPTFRTDSDVEWRAAMEGMPPMPASWHRCCAFRAADHFRMLGERVRITYID